MTLPNSAVLFLRCDDATPDRMEIEIITPGGTVGYPIPVMKSQKYSIDEIFEKGLLFLIPFYIFSHERRFKEYNGDKGKLGELQREYKDITDRIEQLLNAGVISEYTKCTIMDMANKVLVHIARKYENVREGVKQVMGGRVLDYEAKRIKNEGREEGRAEGREEGIVEGKAAGIVETGVDFGLSDKEILDKLQIKLNISLQMAQEYFSKYGK